MNHPVVMVNHPVVMVAADVYLFLCVGGPGHKAALVDHITVGQVGPGATVYIV